MDPTNSSNLIAIAASTFTILGTMISLFLWMRSEANSDRRQIQDIQREDRKDLLQISRNIENEMKDFHHRLLKIEEKKIKTGIQG
jgi:hypothetical protein